MTERSGKRARKTRRKATPGLDLMGVPSVIALRLPLIASEMLASPYGGKETSQASSEKINAAMEGAIDAYGSLWQSTAKFWFEAATGRTQSGDFADAWSKAAKAAIEPSGKMVSANLKRLLGPGSAKPAKKR